MILGRGERFAGLVPQSEFARDQVKEEVRVGKRRVQDTEQVSGTVKKEKLRVENTGDAAVRTRGRGKQ